jgi:hypothetical protein
MNASFTVKTQKIHQNSLTFCWCKDIFYAHILNWKPIIHLRNWMWAVELILNALELIWAAGCHY